MRRSSILRTAGIILLSVGAAVGGGHAGRARPDRASPAQPVQSAGAETIRRARLPVRHAASVELVQLLRDFAAWEPNPILRKRRRRSWHAWSASWKRNRTGAAGGPTGIAG
jgi:hypothetical protein